MHARTTLSHPKVMPQSLKYTLMILFLQISLLSTGIAQNCQNNLISNPGFESGTSPWNPQGDIVITTDAHSGNSAVEICNGAGGVTQAFPAQEGSTYTASFYGKISGSPQTSYGRLRFLGSNWAPLPNDPANLSNTKIVYYSTDYQLYTLTNTAPAGAAYIQFITWKEGDGCMLIDEVELCEGTGNPSTVTINCSGITNNEVMAAAGVNGAIVNYFGYSFGTTCPSGIQPVSVISGLPAGSFFPLGTTEVCLEIKDNCGDAAQCCFIVTVTPTGMNLPDLVPVVSVGNTTVQNNGIIDYSIQIANEGTGTGDSGGFIVYLSSDDNLSSDDSQISSASPEPYILSPGQLTNALDLTYIIPASNTFNGTKYIFVVVDQTDNVEEMNEANNYFSFPIQISTPTVPTDCTTSLGNGEILCTERQGDVLQLYVEESQTIRRYTLNATGEVQQTEITGLLVEDSVLVVGNQVVKKLADGTVVFTKTIPQAILDSIPVVDVAAELSNGSLVLAGYRRVPTPMPLGPARNRLVLVNTDADLNPLDYYTRIVSQNFNPYYIFTDFSFGISPLANGYFDIFYTQTVYGLITYKNYLVNRFSFQDPVALASAPIEIGTAIGAVVDNGLEITKTPCNSYRIIGPTAFASQKGYFFGRMVAYYDQSDLSLISSQVAGSGSLDYYGGYDSWSFRSTPPDSLNGNFQYRPGYDPVPMMSFVLNNPGEPMMGIELPFFNYQHAVAFLPDDILLFGEDNGTLFVEVPTDCGVLEPMLPDLIIKDASVSPATVAQGEDVIFTLEIENTGTVVVNDEVNIQVLGNIGELGITNSIPISVSPGVTEVVSFVFNMGFPPNSYDLLINLDVFDAVEEENELNNGFTLPIVVTGNTGNEIDLSLDLEQINPTPNQWGSYPVVATITNSSNIPATGVTVRFEKPVGVVYTGGNEFTVSQGTFNPNSDEIWTVGTLPPGAKAELTVNYFLLQPTAPLAYAEVQTANEADVDSTPGNGSAPIPNEDDEASTNTVVVNQPDLSLTNLEIPVSSLPAGAILSYDFDLSNMGTADAVGDFLIKAWISTDAVLDGGDIQDGIVPTGNLNAGTTIANVTGATSIPSGLPEGVYYLLLQVDADAVIQESNEGNNMVAATFTVDNGGGTMPDLVISNLMVNNPVVEQGSLLNYNFDIDNIGPGSISGSLEIRAFFSDDPTVSNNDEMGGSNSLNISPGTAFPSGNLLGQSSIIVPPGDYYLIVWIDALEDFAESNESNNYVALPVTVINNQGGDIDLSISLTADTQQPPVYSNLELDLFITNSGPQTATGIVVDFPRPSGTVYTGGNEWSATKGTFYPFGNEQWEVGDLMAGETATLTVHYFLLTADPMQPYAQIVSANENDGDSTPGNGTCCFSNEDDEAGISINSFNGGGGIALTTATHRLRLAIDEIYPVPAKDVVYLNIFSNQDQLVEFDVYDVMGHIVYQESRELEKGDNKWMLEIEEWRSGNYVVIVRGNGTPAYGRLVKVWE